MNTDGSKKGDHTSGGGIARDSNGNFIYGFNMVFDHHDILRAELKAILEGILLCKQLGFSNYSLETDSSIAYSMIKNSDKEQRQYSYVLRWIRANMDDVNHVRLIYREANKVADLLAKVAHQTLIRVNNTYL